MPFVSVILPVFNGESFVRDAIDSVLGQTFRDFEFLIFDDGSTDGTYLILEEFASLDQRISLYKNSNNLGLPQTLNRGLDLAKGKYIARMDADDICVPDRLEKQVAYMETHPEIAISGAWVQIIGEGSGEIWGYPEEHDAIYAKMLFANTLMHPTVIMRREILVLQNLRYDVQAHHVEDYDLWSRALPLVKFANLSQVLLYFRIHSANTESKHAGTQQQTRLPIYQRLLTGLGIDPTEEEILFHSAISQYQFLGGTTNLLTARRWFEKLVAGNKHTGTINPKLLAVEIGHRWAEVCFQSDIDIVELLSHILRTRLPFGRRPGLWQWPYLLFFVLKKMRAVSTR